jgi:hypothetical protein
MTPASASAAPRRTHVRNVTSLTLPPGPRRCGLNRLTHYRARVPNHLPGKAPLVHVVPGFTNRSRRALVAGLLGTTYTASQMTHELRRLRLHGLIQRLLGSNTYMPTPTGSGWPCPSPRSTTGSWRSCWPAPARGTGRRPSRGQLHHQRTPDDGDAGQGGRHADEQGAEVLADGHPR